MTIFSFWDKGSDTVVAVFHLLVGCCELGGQLLPQLLQLLQQKRLLLLQRDAFPLKLLLQLLWTAAKGARQPTRGLSGGRLRPGAEVIVVIIHTSCKNPTSAVIQIRVWLKDSSEDMRSEVEPLSSSATNA